MAGSARTKRPSRPDSATLERRVPTQQRSRDRLARILTCAESLIAAQGSDRLRMAELAQLSGISIGSLYQYFPDKPAIIHALATRYNAESRRCVVETFASVTEINGLHHAFTALMTEFYRLVRGGPVMRDIWAGMQSDKVLAALQLEESRAMGAVLAETISRARSVVDKEAVAVSAFLLWDLGEAAVRLAIGADEQTGAKIIAAYTRMALREFDAI